MRLIVTALTAIALLASCSTTEEQTEPPFITYSAEDAGSTPFPSLDDYPVGTEIEFSNFTIFYEVGDPSIQICEFVEEILTPNNPDQVACQLHSATAFTDLDPADYVDIVEHLPPEDNRRNSRNGVDIRVELIETPPDLETDYPVYRVLEIREHAGD